jgi:hypothetical protein
MAFGSGCTGRAGKRVCRRFNFWIMVTVLCISIFELKQSTSVVPLEWADRTQRLLSPLLILPWRGGFKQQVRYSAFLPPANPCLVSCGFHHASLPTTVHSTVNHTQSFKRFVLCNNLESLPTTTFVLLYMRHPSQSAHPVAVLVSQQDGLMSKLETGLSLIPEIQIQARTRSPASVAVTSR